MKFKSEFLNEGKNNKLKYNGINFLVSFNVGYNDISYQLIPLKSKDLDEFNENKDKNIEGIESLLKKKTGIDFKYDVYSEKAGADFKANKLDLSEHMLKMIK